jgi:hypothetical protein
MEAEAPPYLLVVGVGLAELRARLESCAVRPQRDAPVRGRDVTNIPTKGDGA